MFTNLYVKTLILLLLVIGFHHKVPGQKKSFNREVLQLNYDASQFMKQGDYEGAVERFNKALLMDPEATFIIQNRSLCHQYAGDTTLAIDDLNKMIRLEPDNTECLFRLGDLYKSKKDTLTSVDFFKKAIQTATNGYDTTKLLIMSNFCGNFYNASEKYDTAVSFYEKANAIKPGNSSVMINLACCYYLLDSMKQFCNYLEQAFIHGGAVDCNSLKKWCDGCDHLMTARKTSDTLSKALDIRFLKIVKNEPENLQMVSDVKIRDNLPAHKVTVYFNHYFEITSKEKASYFRTAFWSDGLNFFGGLFTDYYISGEKLAEGYLDRKKLQGNFIKYYRNGNKMVAGGFKDGLPVGKMTFYKENGEPDFEVHFEFDEFDIRIINQENPMFTAVNSKEGKFSVIIERIHDVDFTLKGKYTGQLKEGVWSYNQGNIPITKETFIRGKFRSGTIITQFGTKTTMNSYLKSDVFEPPYCKQIRNLLFESAETKNLYPYISSSIFHLLR